MSSITQLSARLTASVCVLLLGIVSSGTDRAGISFIGQSVQSHDRPSSETLTRVIIQSANNATHVRHQMRALAGFDVSYIRPMSGNAHILELSVPVSRSIVSQLLATLQSNGVIDFGQIDASVQVSTNPNDELYSKQWQLDSSANIIASLDMEKTWEITTGSPENVIAVIDTGIRFDHVDLTNRLLSGYDFVSGINEASDTVFPVNVEHNYIKTHDGDGRDPDPTDPGDGVDISFQARMNNVGIECPLTESTWHGTAMASLLGANGNDGTGMTGIDWQASILPVRAVGRCGGSRSDLLDAIRWAAGVEDPLLPVNPNPARIINLSLGIDDKCGPADQRAINEAISAGAIIVAAVGNQGRNIDIEPAAPADCDNVIGVAAVNASGQRASYSNFGYDADISAPGGEDVGGDGKTIIVAANDGLTDPLPGSSYRYTTGTSVASPMVSGVLSLMLSVNPALTNAELESILYHSSRPFTTVGGSTSCTATTCGAGMLDAYSAVIAARKSLSELPPVYVKPQFEAALPDSAAVKTGNGCSIGGSGVLDPQWWIALVGLSFWRCRRRRQRVVRQ